jgi:hypothetical protein
MLLDAIQYTDYLASKNPLTQQIEAYALQRSTFVKDVYSGAYIVCEAPFYAKPYSSASYVEIIPRREASGIAVYGGGRTLRIGIGDGNGNISMFINGAMPQATALSKYFNTPDGHFAFGLDSYIAWIPAKEYPGQGLYYWQDTRINPPTNAQKFQDYFKTGEKFVQTEKPIKPSGINF